MLSTKWDLFTVQDELVTCDVGLVFPDDAPRAGVIVTTQPKRETAMALLHLAHNMLKETEA